MDLLRSGRLPVYVRTVMIDETAEADLTIDAKMLGNAPQSELYIRDIDGNSVYLNVGDAHLTAYVMTDDAILCGLPDNYKQYRLHLRKTLHLSNDSVDCMLQLKRAEELLIYSDTYVMYRLLDQPQKLAALTELSSFMFRIFPSSYANIRLSKLFGHMPALEVVHVLAWTLQPKQIEKFIHSQGTPKKWNVEVVGTTITFEMKEEEIAQNKKRLIDRER